ncbi:carbohydrate ABC transporter permease [Cellulomonas sp. PhB143]|uniref:carbohydrate ABC transporter permease n=1 Tax=Cellulomonas sp. PhB143 TaxID=2485186 RepID=UPI000F472D5B|nr:sugar ABC transporter permease [Cellulomonas sp. PhB143]ROS76882.1 carbohydrate ABC transporter membrane protein 1 (CUT1 family) [Cellulomonas sp. PhB143]
MARTTVGTGRPGALWAVPALGFFGLFALLPMAIVVYLSFTQWSGIGSPVFTGTDNWTKLAHDTQLMPSLRLTIGLTIVSWLLQTAICLPLGVWLAHHGRGRAVLAAVFFVPLLMSSAAIAILWGGLLDPNFGLASVVGPLIGVPDGNFIGDPDLVFWVVVAVVAWQFVPFHVLLYQGATRQVPGSLYEAARIDGAGRFRQFTAITVPQLKHTIITSSVLMLVGSMTYFEIILILTGGGPGTATRVLPLHMYIEGFQSFDMGYASVLAVLLLVLGTALSLFVTRATGFHRMDSQKEGL